MLTHELAEYLLTLPNKPIRFSADNSLDPLNRYPRIRVFGTITLDAVVDDNANELTIQIEGRCNLDFSPC